MGIQTAGMGQVAKLCVKDVDDGLTFDSIVIGTGTTAVGPTQPMVTEQQRSTGATTTGTIVTTTSMSFVKDAFSFGGSYTISEVGVINNDTSGGTLLCRSLLSPYVSVTSSDTLKVTVLVEVKQGA